MYMQDMYMHFAHNPSPMQSLVELLTLGDDTCNHLDSLQLTVPFFIWICMYVSLSLNK